MGARSISIPSQNCLQQDAMIPESTTLKASMLKVSTQLYPRECITCAFGRISAMYQDTRAPQHPTVSDFCNVNPLMKTNHHHDQELGRDPGGGLSIVPRRIIPYPHQDPPRAGVQFQSIVHSIDRSIAIAWRYGG